MRIDCTLFAVVICLMMSGSPALSGLQSSSHPSGRNAVSEGKVLVALMPARDAEGLLPVSIPPLCAFVDIILVLSDCSRDNTVNMGEVLQTQCARMGSLTGVKPRVRIGKTSVNCSLSAFGRSEQSMRSSLLAEVHDEFPLLCSGAVHSVLTASVGP